MDKLFVLGMHCKACGQRYTETEDNPQALLECECGEVPRDSGPFLRTTEKAFKEDGSPTHVTIDTMAAQRRGDRIMEHVQVGGPPMELPAEGDAQYLFISANSGLVYRFSTEFEGWSVF